MGPSGSIEALTIVSATSVSTSANKTISVSCSGGTNVLGGGFVTNSAKVGAQESYPSAADTWTVNAVEFVTENANWTVTVYAICA
jgi:hypothetical protein